MRAGVGCSIALVLVQTAGTGSFERGLAAFRASDWNTAEAAFREAAGENPRSARAWKFLGMTYAAQERYESSLDPFRRACRLDPKEENACYHLGQTFYNLNRYEESRTAYESALRSGGDRGRGRVLHGLALSLEALGRTDEAEARFLGRGHPQGGTRTSSKQSRDSLL
jgi:tetratricopeptide (TPR) repeat protein